MRWKDACVRDVLKCPRAPRHAEILQPVLGEDRQLRRALRGIVRFDAGDDARKDLDSGGGRSELDGQLFAEVEEATVEELKTDVAILRSPVEQVQLAAGKSQPGLLDQH